MAKTLTFRDPRTPPARLTQDAADAWRDFFRVRPAWRGDTGALARHCRTVARSMERYRESQRIGLLVADLARLMKSKRGREKATLQAAWLELGHRQLEIRERNRRDDEAIRTFLRSHPKPGG